MPPLQLDEHAQSLLKEYRWSGNIRQLRTVVERLHVLSESQFVTPKTLQNVSKLKLTDSTRMNIGDPYELSSHRRQMVEIHLQEGGSVDSFAKGVGVHRSTVYRWLKTS